MRLPGSIKIVFSKSLLRWFVILDLLMISVLTGTIISNLLESANISQVLPFAVSQQQTLGMSHHRHSSWNDTIITPSPTIYKAAVVIASTLTPTVTPTPSMSPSTVSSNRIDSMSTTPTATPRIDIQTATPSTPTPTTSLPIITTAQANTKTMFVTLYGWDDNDPPGANIAYPHTDYQLSIHNAAGGSGTYSDPISLATDPSEWSIGTKFYVPYLQKYFVMEDWCAGCVTDWKTQKYHIDLWTNSNGSFSDQLLHCEDSLTKDATDVEINPPADRTVSTTPLFDTGNGSCYKL